MMKMIYTFLSHLMPTLVRDRADWQGDPLSHPAVRAMDPDDLADLSFASMRRCKRR